jgi:uncharacterized membrane protein SpoIIM required for sporulation
MKTKSERFVEEKKENWKKLLSIIRILSKKGIRKLSIEDVEEFPRLYRKSCQDLAEARMLELSPDVLEYLNNITGQAHHYLYFMKPLSSNDLSDFFTRILPGTILKNYKYVLFALILFWGTAVTTYFTVVESPRLAETFLSVNTLDYIEQMYRDPVDTGRSGGQRVHMSAFYIQHNTSIAFLCFATGIFLGFGSLYFLIYNGVFMGSILGYLVSVGLGPHIWEFVTAHSFLEMNAIAIAGAAGVKLGISLLQSWRDYSGNKLDESRGDILTLVAASTIMLFLAAMVEANISPSTLDYKYKVLIALISVVIVVFYFIIYPMRKRGSE